MFSTQKLKNKILEDKGSVTWNARDVLHVEKILTSISYIESLKSRKLLISSNRYIELFFFSVFFFVRNCILRGYRHVYINYVVHIKLHIIQGILQGEAYSWPLSSY